MGGVGGSACRRRLLTRLSISRLARINIVIRVCSVRIKAVPELEAGEDFRCCSSPAGPPEPVIVAVTPEQQQLRLRCEGVRVTLLFDPPEPTRIRMVVKEDSEVVLNCSASGSVRDQVFDWKKDDDVEVFLYSWGSTYGSGQFAGRVAHFPEALDLGNASIRIKKAEVRDSGIYTCRFPHSAPVLRSEISLVVGEFLHPTHRKVFPQVTLCEVEGAHPRPAVQWQDSSGRVLPAQETESEERDGLFYVTVRANVSRSDNYSCVVTQEEFCHQINSTTFVDLGELWIYTTATNN
uniref:Ig-like domain-containing protein n=1 Tax=Takifugu rubripes TaxID=31033 RepID=A0A674MEA7_TAKRU